TQGGLGFVWGGVADASGYLFEGEAEFRVAKPLGLAAALVHYGYEWGNGERLAPGVRAEEEEGEGYGLGAELRWYTSGRAFGGFYLGAGVSAFPFARWTSRQDDDLSGVYEEDEIRRGRDAVYDVHAALGFTWRPHKGFALSPNVIFGNFFSRSPDSGLYAGVGLRGSLGF
ncbi:MAG: hypothetical protein L0216_13000, partial [Planctomycetales bacterium]|nr:hypothetical protein [Planctomycetales bacterium]